MQTGTNNLLLYAETHGTLCQISRLVGFDSGGEVFLTDDRVLRGIYRGKGELYRDVLKTCLAHDLFRFGIVKTWQLEPNPYPDLPYDFVLEHEKIPFVSYAHEWAPSMLKDAALFHIDLYLELGKYGLTIKDWHPYNILFRGPKPILVDFASIIPANMLEKQEYLAPIHLPSRFKHVWDKPSACFFEMYIQMHRPYFLLPLYLMHRREHSKARSRLQETTLNAVDAVITPDEVFSGGRRARWLYGTKERLKKLALIQRGPVKDLFLKTLRKEIESLSVNLESSGYSDYYAAKREDYAFEPSESWTLKHLNVYEAIKRFRPQTLLDLACNTGWFSILAAKLGCRVVAVDVDEACIDILYNRVKSESLCILPLVMDLTEQTPDLLPLPHLAAKSRSAIGGQAPLVLAAWKRLGCDMVLALAIVHHLALGMGYDFKQIVKMLVDLTQHCLLIEFVAKEDQLIVSHSESFPRFNACPSEFEWYTLDALTRELAANFRSIEVRASYPRSRTILICEK